MRAVVIAIALFSVAAQAQAPAAPSSAPAPAAAAAAPAPPAAAPSAAAPSAAAPAPVAAAPVAAAPAADWTARFDELWKSRDQDTSIREMNKLLKAAQSIEPNSFDASWRQSAVLNWQANGFPDGNDLKAQLGKGAWEAGDRAAAAKPEDVRGQYNAGTGIGLYSEGVGILTALSQGLEGKFRSRVQAAIRIDKGYLDGAPQVLWGRFFFKLPWPKRDLDESVKILTAAVKDHPTNLRAKIFLADSLADSGKGDEAKALAQQALEANPGIDLPEEKRLHEMAKKWLERH